MSKSKKQTPVVGDSSRRKFIKQSATATAAVAAVNAFKTPVYGQSTAPSTGRTIGANDRIVVGYIGVGGQGFNSHVKNMKNNAGDNNIAQAAVCDVWTKRIDNVKNFIGGDCQGYDDYRKLLERKDIDAVVISTHDTWHTPCSVDAMESGKHVYVEKPMTRYLEEAFTIHDAVKKTGKILQIGSQGTSAAAWHKAGEMIRAGKIGKLVWAQGFYCRNNPKGEWNYTIDPDAKPENLNWEKWLGPVKKRIPFDADHFFRWRKYYPYCGGLLGDLVPHRLYPLMLATGNPEYPVRVTSIGSKHVKTDAKNPDTKYERDVPEHVQLTAQFPSGMAITVSSSTVNAKSPGFVIYGHHATIEIGSSGEKIDITPEKFMSDEIDPESISGLTPTESIPAHHKNWFDSIRANKQPNGNIDLATKGQIVICLAEMSERLGIMCHFNEKTRKVTDANGKEIKAITYGTLPLS